MKKNILSILVCLVSFTAYNQDIPTEINQTYLKFLPSNMDPNEILPSDIPSEQVLQQMGLSSEEISEAMDFKYNRGKYSANESDTSSKGSNAQKFYKNMGEKTSKIKVNFPKSNFEWINLFLLALVCQFGGQFLITFGIGKISPSNGSIGLLMQPLTATILAAFLFSEWLNLCLLYTSPSPRD